VARHPHVDPVCAVQSQGALDACRDSLPGNPLFIHKRAAEFFFPCLQGTLYIEEPGRNPVRHVHSHTQMERHLLNTYWGYKFEQLVTNGSVQRPSMQQKQRDIVSPVNSNEAYCSVLRTKFGDHSIVLGAEVDCTGT